MWRELPGLPCRFDRFRAAVMSGRVGWEREVEVRAALLVDLVRGAEGLNRVDVEAVADALLRPTHLSLRLRVFRRALELCPEGGGLLGVLADEFLPPFAGR